MDTMQESATKIAESVEAMVAKHDKAVGRFWGVLITIIIAGAGAIGVVYVFSVARADAAIEKAQEVERNAETTVAHNDDVTQRFDAYKTSHDEIDEKDDEIQRMRHVQTMQALRIATPPSRRADLPPIDSSP